MAKTLRVTLTDDLHAELAAIADAQDIDLGELVKRSVALTKWVWEHRDAPVFADINGEVAELVFFGGAGSMTNAVAHNHHWPDSDTTFHHTHERGERPHGHRQLLWGPVPGEETRAGVSQAGS